MKIKVGVIFGGRTVEHEVSIISAIQTIHAIDKAEYDVIPLYITKDGTWYTGDALLEIKNYRNLSQLLSNCKKILISLNSDENTLFNYPQRILQKRIYDKIDVAFPVMHGTHGEDGTLQGLLEMMNIPYVGCGVFSSAVGMDKIAQKIIFGAAGLPIVKYSWFYARKWLQDSNGVIDRIEKEFDYPFIIKPADLGSSIAVTKVNNRNELVDAVDLAKSFSQRIIAEELVPHLKEVNCSVLGDYEHVETSVCEEPISHFHILNFQDKYLSDHYTKGMSGAKRKLPADIPEEMSKSIQEMAKQAFLSLNCQGIARIDFLVNNATKQVFINEINTIPGSLAFYLWEATGKSFTELTNELIKLALKRDREKNNLIFSYESNILSAYKEGVKGLKK